MDISIQFSQAFGSRNFATFIIFQQALEEFHEATSSKFIFKRTFLFPHDSPKRETLVYKSIHYVCVESKQKIGTHCEASFNVGCRHGFLYVSKFHMLHNHECIYKPREIEPEPEPYVVMTDYTQQFSEIFTSLQFSSYIELHSKMEEFQSITGSMYAKRHTCPWPKEDLEKQHLVYKKYAYECYHYGYNKQAETNRSDHRLSTTRTGCKSIVYVACRNSQLHIARFDMRHNHPISGSSGNIYRRNRRLNADQQLAVKELLKDELHEFALKEYIQNSFQLYLTTTDVRNLKRKLQPRKNSKELIGITLRNLYDGGLVDAPVDGEGIHRMIAFTSPELITLFHNYPEVIQIQELRGYSQNGYPVYHISIIDRNLMTHSVFFSFIIDHHRDTFSLMLQAFKRLMKRKIDEIETVFIDSNTATQCHAVRQELSWTRPLLYQCQVLRNIKNHLVNGFDYGSKTLFQLFYSALKAKNRDTYLSALEDILNTSNLFWEYVNEVWMPYADQWAEHLRLSQVTFGGDNKHNSEEMLNIYSKALLGEKSLDLCAKSLIDIAILRISEATEENRSNTISRSNIAQYSGQPDDIQALLRLLSEPVAKQVLAHLVELKDEDVLTLMSEQKCFCSFNRQLRMPCRHLIERARASYTPLPSLLKDTRWLIISCQTSENMELRQKAVKEEETQESDVYEHEFWTPDSKYSRITPHLQTIQELAITSDMFKFKRRREELRELESRWLKEDTSETLNAANFTYSSNQHNDDRDHV